MGLLGGLGAVAGGLAGGVAGLPGMLLGGSAGSSILGGSEGGMPEYQYAQLDPEVAALQDRMLARAERPASAIADETMAGTDKAGLLKAAQADREGASKSLGYTDEMGAIDHLISNRANKHYEQSLGDLERRVRTQAPVERFQRMARGADIQDQAAAINEGIIQRQLQDTMNRRAARNATIGNVLGIAGGAAGFALGGPVGAQIGLGVGGGMGGNKNTEYMGNVGRRNF